MLRNYRFKKNERGFSEFTFPILRNVVIPTSNWLFNPVIVNPENMPMTGPCFIFGNHANYFDPFLINSEMTREPTAGVMTRDQFEKTIPRLAMDSIGIVPTSKYVAEPSIVRDVFKMIDQNRMIVIFPEGGRRWDGRPKPFIETTVKLFWKMGIPIHPVQIHGSYLGWPRWADWPRKNRMQMNFLKPMHPSDYPDYDTFSQACYDAIDFEEYDAPESTYPFKVWKPASGVSRFLYRCPDTGMNGGVFSPDGKKVRSRYSSFSYQMDNASRLVDRDGKKHSLIQMFDDINSMPLVYVKDEKVLQAHGKKFYWLDKKTHKLSQIGKGSITLGSNEIRYAVGSLKKTLPLHDIQAMSIEQNHKLTLTSDSGTIQVNLEGQSALQWQLYIRRLQTGEKPVKSL